MNDKAASRAVTDEDFKPVCLICDDDTGPMRAGQGGVLVCEDGEACHWRTLGAWMPNGEVRDA